MLTIECPQCGIVNKVELAKLTVALCGACKEKLIEDTIPDSISNTEIATTLDTVPDTTKIGDVDVGPWIKKIGDHDKQTKYVTEGFWAKVKKYASKVTFARNAVAMYYCAVDSETPFAVKATAIGALAYWILPIDLIPDFIPVAGFVDDASAILIAYKAIAAHITAEHHKKADEFFAN
jgi:uncharacterized membrane protein YkvA (DUF1232 family)